MVHFFLVMLFASDPAYLGWDTTVQLVRSPSDDADTSGVQYDYTVEDADGTLTVYRTLGLIAESSESNLRQGLRVWRAVEIRDGAPHGETVVLKDMWRATEVPQEGANMRAACNPQPDRAMSDEEKEALRRSGLTVLHHGDVTIRVRAPTDSDSRKKGASKKKGALKKKGASKKKGSSEGGFLLLRDRLDIHRDIPVSLEHERHDFLGTSATPSLYPWGASENLSGRLVHYRMVVNELCTPMRDIRWDHTKVYPVIAQVCQH